MTNAAIWTISDPAYAALLRRASEERSAAVYAALAPLRRAASWLAELAAQGGTRLRRMREAARTVRALSALSDHSLADIGLTRRDVDALAAGLPVPKSAAAAAPADLAADAGIAAASPGPRPPRRPLALSFRDTLQLPIPMPRRRTASAA